MMLANVSVPANATCFYAFFLDIVNFDILPTDGIYAWAFELSEGAAISVNFDLIGYDTIYMIKNLGSVFIFMQYFPIMALAIFVVKRINNYNGCQLKLKNKLLEVEKSMYWNGLFGFMIDGYIVFAVTAAVNTLHNKGLAIEFDHYGQALSLILASFFAILCLIFPIVTICILCKNLTKIKDRDEDTEKFEILYEELNIPKTGSYHEKLVSGWHSILYSFLQIIRVTFLAICVVTLINYSYFCIFFINFSTLFMMIAS